MRSLRKAIRSFKKRSRAFKNFTHVETEKYLPNQSSQGSLRCEDIEGSSPSKFGNRNKRVFVDRNEIKSVLGNLYLLRFLGQTPGKYHGYVKDYAKGGTYKESSDGVDDMIIKDLHKQAKSKIKGFNFIQSNKNADKILNMIKNKSMN